MMRADLPDAEKTTEQLVHLQSCGEGQTAAVRRHRRAVMEASRRHPATTMSRNEAPEWGQVPPMLAAGWADTRRWSRESHME